eukprot:806119-Pyramimonas_sp.AAC.1
MASRTGPVYPSLLFCPCAVAVSAWLPPYPHAFLCYPHGFRRIRMGSPALPMASCGYSSSVPTIVPQSMASAAIPVTSCGYSKGFPTIVH